MSEVYWLSQAFDMIKRYVACVQAAFADPHLVRFEMTTNFGCALNAESIIDCLSQKKFYAIPSYQRAYKWDTEHVTRLLSEICRYYYDSTQKFQSCVGYDLTKHAKFIGTVILVRDEQLKKKIFEEALQKPSLILRPESFYLLHRPNFCANDCSGYF